MASGASVCDHASYQAALATFTTIATETGILSSQVTREPTPAERDALWKVVRAFTDRLYALDIDPDARPAERHHLAHYAIVALHWCDIYLSDPRHRMDDGRFRRDTLALALCLFCRVDRDYPWYQSLRQGWIAPHVNFSFLMWTLQSIEGCGHDNLFQRFTREEAQAAQRRKQALLQRSNGYIPAEEEPADSPLHRIWLAVRDGVLGADGPDRFALAYIWNGPDLPGGMGLLPADREMNQAYLQRKLRGEPIEPPRIPSTAPAYLEPPAYPGAWYHPNRHWGSRLRALRITNFPKVFAAGTVEPATLFRRFTADEVDRIAGKIRRTKTLILLPFVHRALASRFDLRGMRVPFWFIPFVAFGNDRGGVFYFEENGFYTNHEAPGTLGSTGHVDRWDLVTVEAGYNGLDRSDADDAVLTSLRIEATNASGQRGEFNIVEFHGPDHGATLHIVLAIWEAVWRPVVERSRGASAFLKGPPPWPKAFESWAELVDWADTPDGDDGV